MARVLQDKFITIKNEYKEVIGKESRSMKVTVYGVSTFLENISSEVLKT